MAPGYLTEHEEYMDKINWRHSLVAKCSDMEDVYDKVTKEFDTLLAKHGYVRENGYYRVEKESTETITLFCHFGLICVLLSHLWNVSPFTLWNSFALAPTSVTEVVTEERKQGIAYFRGLKIGDISHLYAGNEEPSFAARFCETYSTKVTNIGDRLSLLASIQLDKSEFICFNSGRTVKSITMKHKLPPITLDTGSAINTPLLPIWNT